MNKLFKLTLCFTFALLLNISICYASTSEAVSTASYLEMYSGLFANEINSPYQAEQSIGMVDASSGTMEVNVEDLYVPGKNGLDLSVKRHFNTLTSPMKYYYKEYSSSGKNCVVGYYRDYLCVEKNEVITIIFDNEEQLIDAGEGFTGIHPSERMGHISFSNIYYDELHVKRGTYTYTLYNRTITPKTKTTTYYNTAYTYKFDGGYLNMENGWVLQVPSIEKYDYYYDYYDGGHSIKYYMIFQDRLGKVYTYDYEISKDDGEEWELDGVNEPKWEPFVFQYVNKKKIKETAVHPHGFTYTSTITMVNGDVYYFFTDGVSANQKLQAIEDKYGNIILFEVNYIDTKITDYVITDTYGNIYTVNQNGITKGTGESAIQLVEYEWELNINSTEDVYNEYTLDNTHILTVTKNTGTTNLISDTEPHKTKYYHMQKYQYPYPLHNGKYLMYKLPYKVETPNGLTKNYEYDVYTEWEVGIFPNTYQGRLYYVDKSYETFDNKTNNVVEYEYNIVLGHNDINYLYDSTEKYYDEQTLIKTIETTYDTEKDGDPPSNIKITDEATGKVVEYDYTYMNSLYPTGLVASETYTNGEYSHTKTYDYTEKGNIKKEINGDYIADYTYYEDNYQLPHTISYKKDANTTVKTENLHTTDGKSIATQNVYENDVLKSITNFTYDTYGNVISSSTLKDDGTYATTNYTYTYGTTSYTVTSTQTGLVNADGDAIDNITTSKTYDYQNNLLSETDGNGNTTTYTYDNANRLTKITYPNGTYDTYSYDITNNVTTLTTRTGAVYKVYFDGNGNAVKYTKGNDITEQAEYDSIGRLIEYQRIYSPTNKTKVNYTYDYLDRITSEKIYDNSTQISSATFAYSAGEDANDRITNTITKTVPGFATEQATTDYMGNTIMSKTFTSDDERVYTYTYDYVGNMLTQTNPKNQTDTYTYDYANRVLTHTDADGNTKTNTYDKLGMLVTESDYMGNNISYVYDNLGRNVSTSMQNGALTKTYYDANGNVTKTQIKSNTEGEAEKFDTVEYDYDAFNRITMTKQYADDNTPVYTNYWYDFLESAMVVTYGDDNNSVWDLGSDTAEIDYSIDPYGNVTAMTTP